MPPDASVPILSEYECQRMCLEKRDVFRTEFAVNLDCSKFPLFVATCPECSPQSGIALVCD